MSINLIDNKNNVKITIFTPTFNRASHLIKLGESLNQQQDKNFEWLIIDDGSIDNTEEVVSQLVDIYKFPIRYFKKQNEGKHIAINLGVQKACGIWFFMVDSDDVLTSDALFYVNQYISQIQDDSSFVGVAGLKGDSNNKPWNNWCGKRDRRGDKQERVCFDATSIDYRYKYKISGDRAEVVRTNAIKSYPFPKFPDENFLNEEVLWFSLSNDSYKLRWFSNVIYIAEYLDDGLSRNIKTISKKNWKGMCYTCNCSLKYKGIPLIEKLRRCTNYYRYGLYGKMSLLDLYWESSSKLLSIPCLVVALLYKIQ